MAKKASPQAAVKPVENSPAQPINIALLAALVKATVGGGSLFVMSNDSSPLVFLKMAEINPAMTDANGAFATRATPQGIEYMALNEVNQPQTNTATSYQGAIIASNAPKVVPKFEIDSDVPVPGSKRGGPGRASKYDFSMLEPGQSIHFAPTADMPEPWKALASTVTTWNGKYAAGTGEMESVTVSEFQVDAAGKRVKVDGHYVKLGDKIITREKTTQAREFVLREVGADDKRGVGGRVFRLR